MVDLEERMLKRDRGFLLRLALFLVVGVGVGVFLYMKMTSSDFGTCAAGAFDDVAQPGSPATDTSQ